MERIKPRDSSENRGISFRKRFIFKSLSIVKIEIVAIVTLPKTIMKGLRDKNFPNSPASPKRNTAT